jgi:hypothetical protein
VDALLSRLCIRLGPVKSKQSRTRTRECSIKRSPGTGTHQKTLDFTQRGISRKDDPFKVVFNPGADKREKGILRQIIHLAALTLIRASLLTSRVRATDDTGSAWLRIQRRESETQLI